MSSTRGVTCCRGCQAERLVSVLDLGDQPLANGLSTCAKEVDPGFPLHLRICQDCGLGQLGEFVAPDEIFSDDYPYLSSVSMSWMEHASAFADEVTASLELDPESLVVEVASNDGYLLEQFQRRRVGVLGVEPALGVANIARAKGIETVDAFFGAQTASEIVATHGTPRLIVANNVMAHVPDLLDFAQGLAQLCGDRTVITIENPSFVNLLVGGQFDTIYHEHFSYLSAHAVVRAVARVGLQLFRVDVLPTHGGSNRYWVARTGERPVEPSVSTYVEGELRAGLLDPDTWTAFRIASQGAIASVRAWLDRALSDGLVVAGYGAAAKGNTLLNAAGASAQDLLMVADSSQYKQGKLLPGSKIPVVAPADLPADLTDVLILPWNLAREITGILQQSRPDARCWTAIPTIREVR